MPTLYQKVGKYWWFQLIGWGTYLLINLFFLMTFGRMELPFFYRLALAVALGLLITHGMRWIIHETHLVQQALDSQIRKFLLLTIIVALVYSGLHLIISDAFHFYGKSDQRFSFWRRFMAGTVNYFVVILIWNVIYFVFHYMQRTRRQEMDTLRLEALVKTLELKTIKSHINPHFIFNALNSIRALVDMDPARARTAITALSNILRSSMQTDKQETVPLSQELAIVKDYLALEHIRFEDRLKVDINVDPETLSLPVPPMMLQTLVENAIKHGISKQMEGGLVSVESQLTPDFHVITIENTGQLERQENEDGFGIISTLNRLQLLFGNAASFALKNLNNDKVRATVKIPIELIA